MGKNTSFIKHTSCESCGSSDANAVYSDGSAYCFSCRKNTAAGTQDTEVEFNVVQSQLTLDEIQQLPIDTFRGISKKVIFHQQKSKMPRVPKYLKSWAILVRKSKGQH